MPYCPLMTNLPTDRAGSGSLALLLVTLTAASVADPPLFGPYQLIDCGSSRIDVGSHSSPMVADWNGDGLKDLLVGQFDNGMIRFYENVGSNELPVFESFEYLCADGQPILLPFG